MEKVEVNLRSTTAKLPSSPRLEKLDSNDSTKVLFIWLSVLGIIMPKTHKVAYVIYSIIFNTLTILILPQLFILSYFTAGKIPLGLLLTSVQTCVNTYPCAVKFLLIAFMRRNIFNMAPIMKKLDARVKYQEEIDEIRWVIAFGRWIFICLGTCYMSYSVCIFIGGILKGEPMYALYIPYLNWRDSKRNLLIASVIEYILMSMASFQNVANDTYGIVYVKIIYTHLELLILRVLRIGADGKTSCEENRKELMLCIRDHKNIIELIDTISPLISATNFVQFLASASCLSTTLVNILIFGERSTMIGSIVYVGALLAEIFPICYFVNCLTIKNESLPMAIFHMNWADQDLKFRRLCLFFMHRSQQPLILLAGKMFPISLNSFVSIVKFSFSLYTLLGTMDLAERFK